MIDPARPLDVLGIYFTVISILLIFQVLELQIWIEAVNQYCYDFAHVGDLVGVANRQRRQEWKGRGDKLLARYPTSMTYMFYILQIGLFALGLLLDLFWLTQIPWIYTTLPWVGYLLLVVIGPAILVRRNKVNIKEVNRQLAQWSE